jgi:uncharacterized membrane protein YbhN (UPF0104 family)
MSKRYKQILKLLAKLLITAALLFWVFRQINYAEFSKALKTSQWSFLWLVWGTTVLSYWLLSVKMVMILRKQNCPASIGLLFGASAITALYSMVLPGILDAPVKWYILRQRTGKGSNVFSSMVYNQTTILFYIGATALIALIVTNPGGNWHLLVVYSAILALLIVICLLLFTPTIGPKLTSPVRKLVRNFSCSKTPISNGASRLSHILRPLPASFRNRGLKILEQLSLFQTAPWSFHLKIILMNFAGVTIFGTAIYIFAARTVGIDVPIGVLVWQYSIIFLLGRIPVFIADLGVREATLIGTLALYGVDASSALLMSMIIFSNRILMALIGAAYQLFWSLRRPGKKELNLQ